MTEQGKSKNSCRWNKNLKACESLTCRCSGQIYISCLSADNNCAFKMSQIILAEPEASEGLRCVTVTRHVSFSFFISVAHLHISFQPASQRPLKVTSRSWQNSTLSVRISDSFSLFFFFLYQFCERVLPSDLCHSWGENGYKARFILQQKSGRFQTGARSETNT